MPQPAPSFLRRQPHAPADTGTRPGLRGQTLVSTGLADLDRLLGGGLPLGCLLLLCEDLHSQQHLNFIRYFLAEGVACKQSSCWVTAELPPGGAAAFLPAQGRGGAARTESQTAEAAAEGAEGSGDGGGLRIAWQYRKYIQARQQEGSSSAQSSGRASGAGGAAASSGAQPRPRHHPHQQQQQQQQQGSGAASGSPGASTRAPTGASAVALARAWSHEYDLGKPAGEEALQGARLECRVCSGAAAPLQDAAAAALGFVRRFTPQTGGAAPVPPRAPEAVGRLAWQSLGSPAWLPTSPHVPPSAEQQEAAVLGAVVRLRQAVRDTHCAVLITCPTGLFSPSFAARLQHLCDAVVRLESLSDDSQLYQLLPDAPSAAALLELRRLPSSGLAGCRAPEEPLQVVRYRRRRLVLTPVEVDPDAEAGVPAAAKGADAAGARSKDTAGGGARRGAGSPAAALEF